MKYDEEFTVIDISKFHAFNSKRGARLHFRNERHALVSQLQPPSHIVIHQMGEFTVYQLDEHSSTTYSDRHLRPTDGHIEFDVSKRYHSGNTCIEVLSLVTILYSIDGGGKNELAIWYNDKRDINSTHASISHSYAYDLVEHHKYGAPVGPGYAGCIQYTSPIVDELFEHGEVV